ncbi:MAG: GNAT family N-acetyltransferase [Candidatus Limnocylindrales bacterium]
MTETTTATGMERLVGNERAIAGLRFRAYGGPADLPGLVALSAAANLADSFDMIPTIDQWAGEFDHPDGFDPANDVLVAEVGARIVGAVQVRFARRDEQAIYDLHGDVHPELRRHGLGRMLHRAGVARARERAGSELPADEPTWLGAWAPESNVGHGALMRSEGFTPVRYFFEMLRRDLDAPLPTALPAGVEVRPVTPANLRQVFDAEVEAFQDHWGHRDWGDAVFEQIRTAADLDLSLWRVAWAGDEVAGVVATYVFAAENAVLGVRRGWLERVSVRRPWRRQGLATALIGSACRGLRDRDMTEAALGVDADNPSGALGLYEGLGFVAVQRAIAWRRSLDPRRLMPPQGTRAR